MTLYWLQEAGYSLRAGRGRLSVTSALACAAAGRAARIVLLVGMSGAETYGSAQRSDELFLLHGFWQNGIEKPLAIVHSVGQCGHEHGRN